MTYPPTDPPPGSETPTPPTEYPQYPGHPAPPGAGYPPPPAGYPPPPPGYPPLPHGYAPPPPGYGPPPGYQPPFSGADAWTWAWGQFRKQMGMLIAGPLAWLGIVVAVCVPLVITLVAFGPKSTRDADGKVIHQEPVSTGFVVTMVLFYLAIIAIAMVMQNCLLASQLDVAEGRPLTFGAFFRPRRLGAFLGATLLVFLMTAAGTVACFVPGLIVGFLGQYTTYFVVDRQLGAIDAIKASFKLVGNNLGVTILVYFIVYAVVLGAEFAILLTLGIGSLVIIPGLVSLIGLTHAVTYRRLSGGQVAPVPA